MIVSVLNESYTDAKTKAQQSNEELEMARFIGERFIEMFHKNEKGKNFKLYCDEATLTNMCHFEAEPFCLNSKSIMQGTEERLEKLERRIAALTRRANNLAFDYDKEEDELEILVQSFIRR